MTNVQIDVCCNDPDNGLFLGRAQAIHVRALDLELTSRTVRDPRFVETPEGFVLSGKRWPVMHAKEWYGNWCWNAYWLLSTDAVSFLVWLHGRRLFSIDQGVTELFDRWHSDTPLAAERVRRLIEQAQAEAASHAQPNQGLPK